MANTELKKWQTVNSKYLVNNQWLKLRADSCITAKGHTISPYYVFEYPDWANCFVLDDENNVVMTKHYRHGVDMYLPELVCGGIEKSDPSPETGIRRELEEEIGYVGGTLHQIGVSYPNPSNHTNKVYSFIALGGRCSQEQKLEKGEDLHVVKIPFEDFVHAFEDKNSGTIYHSMHLASIFLALKFIAESN